MLISICRQRWVLTDFANLWVFEKWWPQAILYCDAYIYAKYFLKISFFFLCEWWCKFAIFAFRTLKQEDPKFESSLAYIVRPWKKRITINICLASDSQTGIKKSLESNFQKPNSQMHWTSFIDNVLCSHSGGCWQRQRLLLTVFMYQPEDWNFINYPQVGVMHSLNRYFRNV